MQISHIQSLLKRNAKEIARIEHWIGHFKNDLKGAFNEHEKERLYKMIAADKRKIKKLVELQKALKEDMNEQIYADRLVSDLGKKMMRWEYPNNYVSIEVEINPVEGAAIENVLQKLNNSEHEKLNFYRSVV